MPILRKTACLMLACCLAAALLAGCLNGSTGTEETSPPPPLPTQGSEAQPEARPGQPVHMSAMLPSGLEDFGQALAELAAADGNSLLVRTAPAGEPYTGAVREALSLGEAPDLVWLEDDNSLLQLSAAGSLPFYNFAGREAGPVMNSLAAMAPPTGRVDTGGAAPALPLGYYIEGYVFHLEMLAALLNAQDPKALLGDLYACSWQQWVLLVRSIESYLAKPGRIELRLGAGKYTMPGYRPAAAQKLRGVFAVPTKDAAAITGNALDIMMGLCYSSPQELQQTADAEKQALMRPALASLLGLLELETLHMAQSAGPLWRGEDFIEQESFTAQQAQALFAGGGALFIRGNSRLAHRLEQENPALGGSLAVTPVKLPPPAGLEENAALQEDESSSDAGAESDGVDGQANQTGGASVAGEVVEEVITNSNRGPWFASGGMLCLREGSAAGEAVCSLLLRLYTSGRGQAALESTLGLYCFTNVYPAGTLHRQVADELNAEGWQLVAAPSSLQRAKEVMGGMLQSTLLSQYEWDSAAQEQFMLTAFAALGVPYAAAETPQPAQPGSSPNSGG